MFKAILILLFVASCQSIDIHKVIKKPSKNIAIANPIAGALGAAESTENTESTESTSEEVNPFLSGLQNILKLTVALQHELAQHSLNPIQQALAIQALMLPPGLMAAMMPPQLLPPSTPQSPSPRQAPIVSGGITNPANGFNNLVSTFLGTSQIGSILTGLNTLNPMGSITTAFDNILKGIYGLNLAQIAQLVAGGGGLGGVGSPGGAGGIGSVIGAATGGTPADALGGQTTGTIPTTKAPTV